MESLPITKFRRDLAGEVADGQRLAARHSLSNALKHVPHYVIVVENLPVPFDRRVWQEATALKAAGWDVSVICPKTEDYPKAFETIDGIDIYRHALPLEAKAKYSFFLEYSFAMFHEMRLLTKIYFTKGFDVVQACNPPDCIFVAIAPFKWLGKKFVFDHHDLSPELFVAKFGREGLFHAGLLAAEKKTFEMADIVISANASYRNVAIERGGCSPDSVRAVYSVPDQSKFYRVQPDPELRSKASMILGYLGVIGAQDGVEYMVQAIHELVHIHGQSDIHAVIIGDGTALDEVKALAVDLGVDDKITFTGYLRGPALLSALSSFDIGVIPDPLNPYNDKISLNKVFEYSMLGIPAVGYRLSETVRLLGDVGVYCDGDDASSLARGCMTLIEDADLREENGLRAKALAAASFDWSKEAVGYVRKVNSLLPEDALDSFFKPNSATSGLSVSVVIPVKDREDVLERAIQSILQQSVRVQEIIIVDDGSRDGTVALVKALQRQYSFIKLIELPSSHGACHARNVGAEAATSDVIALLDSDDEWMVNKLEAQLELLEMYPECPAVFGAFRFQYSRNFVRYSKVPELVNRRDLFGRNVLGGSSSAVIRTAAYQRAGGFDVNMPACQDWEFWLRLAKYGPLRVVRSPVVKYHLDGSNRISKNLDRVMAGHNAVFDIIQGDVRDGGEMRRVISAQHLRLSEVFAKQFFKPFTALGYCLSAFYHRPSVETALSVPKTLARIVVFPFC